VERQCGSNVEPILALRSASEYLGDEIVIAGFTGADQNGTLRRRMPVFPAESNAKFRRLPQAATFAAGRGIAQRIGRVRS
jgi:hypothetical protein